MSQPETERRYFQRYIILRFPEQAAMVQAVSAMIDRGYEPCGGVQAVNVQARVQAIVGPGRTENVLGFVQALWLPMGRPLVPVPEMPPEGRAS